MAYGDGNGNTGNVGSGAVSGTGEGDDYGQFVIGTFTAEAPSQLLELTPANGFGNSHFNAILVTEGGGSDVTPVVSEITYEPGSKQLSLTWNSVPGSVYTVSYSTDLLGFDLNLDDDVPASDGETTTATFALSDELATNARLFFRVARNP